METIRTSDFYWLWTCEPGWQS